jgi:hypothetical protein
VWWHIGEVFALPGAWVKDMQRAVRYVPCRCHGEQILEVAEERCAVVAAEYRSGHIKPGYWVAEMLEEERVSLEADGVSLNQHVCVRPRWELEKKPAVTLPGSAQVLCCRCAAALEARESNRPGRGEVARGVLAFGRAQGSGGGGVELVGCREEHLSVLHGFR